MSEPIPGVAGRVARLIELSHHDPDKAISQLAELPKEFLDEFGRQVEALTAVLSGAQNRYAETEANVTTTHQASKEGRNDYVW